MLPWLMLDRATLPGGAGELRLMRRGDEFSIVVGAIELMNSRRGGSEEALATLSCRKMGDRAAPRMLIGGLGMGFTLRASLAALGPDARVVVAELVPAVVSWARGPLAHLFDASLSDPRVDVREEDVAHLIRSQRRGYDAILLDVDNGPDGLTVQANDGLYDAMGLTAARTALRPGGLLAVWSTRPSREFTERLRHVGFGVEEHRVRADGGRRGARHVIWIATEP